MEELRQIFLNAGVSEERIDAIIEYLELKDPNDLKYYTEVKDYEDAGVESKLAQRKLKDYARELKTAEEVQRQNVIEAEKAETQRAAEMQLAAEEKRRAETSVLEDVYTDKDSWIKSITQDGILEFGPKTYIAGLRAAMAANLGVFGAVPVLFHMIEEYAIENAKPAPSCFYTLQRIMTMRESGLVVAAANSTIRNGAPIYATDDGVPIYATESEMANLIQRMHEHLIPSILEAAKIVDYWDKLYSAQSQDTFFKTQVGNRTKVVQYPSPAPIYEAGQNLRISINRTFAGNGIQKALAICNEYEAFISVLNDPDLPKFVGAVDRDSVLTKLGFDANAAAVRSERLIINFVLNIIVASKCPEENELQYCEELCNLVKQIDWSGLTGNPDDTNLGTKSQIPNPIITGAHMALENSSYSAGSIGRIQQMNGQPAALEVGTGIGSGRDC